MSNVHTRIRTFNTRDTYPEQKLDNDLCQTVVAQGRMVFVRGQVGQDLDTAVNVGVGMWRRRPSRRWPTSNQLLSEPAPPRAHLQSHDLSDGSRFREAVYRTIGRWLRGVYPVSTGIVVAGLARPECWSRST